eukprot:TRINITY_DN27579_c0_g1_i1.p1 TRINITY_DN27579_c0_g1~~TRINITY_DN27579_c0_g1_i1.p1  ORF type:complete len:454 (+),score=50.14 TRINITY_DN27579_c0_g1_i1:87-1364(+)
MESLQPGMILSPVFVETKQQFNGTLIVSTVRRSYPRERMEAVAADGVTQYDGIVIKRNDWGTYMDIGCEAPGLLLAGQERRFGKFWMDSEPQTGGQGPAALLSAEENIARKLPLGACSPVYVWHKSVRSGRIYLGLDPRPERGTSLDDLAVDGVTPIAGMVTKNSDRGVFVDVGCELLGLVSRKEMDVDDRSLDKLSAGDVIQVYARRRSAAFGRLALGLIAESRPRIKASAVIADVHYQGVVVSVQHGSAFIDIHCEVTGVLPDTAPQYVAKNEQSPTLARGDRVLVKPLTFDASMDRWRLELIEVMSQTYHEHGPSVLHVTQIQSQTAEHKHLRMDSVIGGTVKMTSRNYKDLLQSWIQVRLGRSLSNTDIYYDSQLADGCWRAAVMLARPSAEGFDQDLLTFHGQPFPKKALSEQSAAKQAL